jgi:hypothetical protein
MTVDQGRPWPLTLLRGLLCVVLTVAFAFSTRGEHAPRLDHVAQDGVSDGGHESPAGWFGRGAPRIVKRLVGIDHLAINAVVPDEIVLAPTQPWEPRESEPIHRHSSVRHRGTSVRGPPA